MRRRFFFQSFVALFLISPLSMEVYAETPMSFETYTPCRGNASFCATRILAKGVIDSGSSDRLRKVLDSWPEASGTIVFDSPGGSLAEGVKIGLLIRERRFDTEVARKYEEERVISEYSTELFSIASEAVCYSACAYAFMGGVSRTVSEDAKYGVHQFRGADRDSGESNAQFITSMLSDYLDRMGVSHELLTAAGVTGANDMLLIGKKEAVLYNIDNQSPRLEEWTLRAENDGQITLVVKQQIPGSDRFIVLLVARPRQRSETLTVYVSYGLFRTSEMNRVRSVVGESTGGQICDAVKCVRAVQLMPWKIGSRGDTLTAAFAINASEFAASAYGNQIQFEPLIGTALSDVCPDVVLNTGGLRTGLKAMSRSW